VDPLFFLSYANNAVLKPFQERFFDDLVEALILEDDTLGDEKTRIGFCDREGIQLGDSWTSGLAEALRTARVFVYIQSQAYFSRLWCGREWAVFRERIDRWMQAPGAPASRPPLMLPVLWQPVARNPPADLAKDIQHGHSKLGEAYAQHGLYPLMKLRDFREDYSKFLIQLARRILEVARNHPLPPGDWAWPDFEFIPNAFEVAAAAAGGPRPGATSPTPHDGGPRHVVFVYVVGTRAEVEHGNWRTNIASYGDGWVDWKPYFPPIERYVGWYAQGVVRDEDLNYERLDCDSGLIERLREAEKKNKIIILVVDTWTLKGTTYQALMKDFDERQFRNCCVVIPWNEDDETRTRAEELGRRLQEVFRRGHQVRARFRFGVKTPQALEAEFTAAINQARKEAFSEIFQKAEGPDYPQGLTHKPVVSATRTD
jgi:FxsC-like protein